MGQSILRDLWIVGKHDITVRSISFKKGNKSEMEDLCVGKMNFATLCDVSMDGRYSIVAESFPCTG
jgi:hypothetical protein